MVKPKQHAGLVDRSRRAPAPGGSPDKSPYFPFDFASLVLLLLSLALVSVLHLQLLTDRTMEP